MNNTHINTFLDANERVVMNEIDGYPNHFTLTIGDVGRHDITFHVDGISALRTIVTRINTALANLDERLDEEQSRERPSERAMRLADVVDTALNSEHQGR